MNQWVNAVKAPFVDVTTAPAKDRPTNTQIAVVWAAIGVLIARVI